MESQKKICPFMSTADKKVYCTTECMLSQTDSVPIRCAINDISDLIFAKQGEN